MNIYTKSERTIKKYTVGEAVESAKRYLKSKGIHTYCCNAVAHLDYSEKITLETLNEYRQSIIDDTMDW